MRDVNDAPDQSMDDVLASIRRVMARDPVAAPPAAPPPPRATPTKADDVLELTEADPDGPPLISAETRRASRDKLSQLSQVDRTGGGGAVESWVTDLMRPVLRDWLDEHLPAIVEAAVEREVRRITRGG